MKLLPLFVALVWLFASCQKDPYYESETNERFIILKDDITSSSNVPILFYWVQGSINSLKYATTCLSTDVKFEKPYLIANGVKFHVYRWQSTQTIADSSGRRVSQLELMFYPE